MCGIIGVYNLDGALVNRKILETMTRTLAHRGPDGEGIWLNKNIGFGHRRLAVRDLSNLGHQPMSSKNREITVIFNGEIYNYPSLKKEIENDYGFSLKSNCDTEILPAGYLIWGKKLFSRLEGMFSLAIWDSRDRSLILARDGMGIKPLFFSRIGNTVRFASEIKAILADPSFSRKINSYGLHRLFTLGYAGPDSTTLDGIKQLEPGTILSIDSNGNENYEYFWKPSRQPVIKDMDSALEIFLPLIDKVVGDHLVSDLNVGVLQSGGIDSSIISLSAAKIAAIPLFTASFSNSNFDESSTASILAKQTKSIHHIVNVNLDIDPELTLRRVVHHFDGQAVDESAAPLLLLTDHIKKISPVLLSGDGGDEFFGGYSTYQATQIANHLRKFLPKKMAANIGRHFYGLECSAGKRLPWPHLLSRFMLGIGYGGDYPHMEWRRYMPEFLIDSIYGNELKNISKNMTPMSFYRKVYDEREHEYKSEIEAALVADQRAHLPGGLLFKSDAMSMANGVELRVPFC